MTALHFAPCPMHSLRLFAFPSVDRTRKERTPRSAHSSTVPEKAPSRIRSSDLFLLTCSYAGLYGLQRRRGDVDHVEVGSGLGHGLLPDDGASEIGGLGDRLGQRYRQALLILGTAARQPPCGDVLADTLISASRRGHDVRTRRYGEADRQAFRDCAFALKAVVRDGQGVGHAAGTGLAFAEHARHRYAHSDFVA